MKRSLATLLAFSMSFSTLAMAQDRDRRDDHRQGAPEERHDGPTHRGEEERGAGPDHNFRRGGRLPPEMHQRRYVVDDWRGHHLNAPPRGYHWVQTGGDYVLVAIASGIIAQVLLGH